MRGHRIARQVRWGSAVDCICCGKNWGTAGAGAGTEAEDAAVAAEMEKGSCCAGASAQPPPRVEEVLRGGGSEVRHLGMGATELSRAGAAGPSSAISMLQMSGALVRCRRRAVPRAGAPWSLLARYPAAALHAADDELHLATLITPSAMTVSAANYCNCARSSVSDETMHIVA